jgi:hypothetical protein
MELENIPVITTVDRELIAKAEEYVALFAVGQSMYGILSEGR